jgi:RNA polymerase sigma-70 factor (ECF subfamily)
MTTATAQARREFEQTALPLTENLYGAAMRLTRDPDDAEDLVQDALIRAFRFWNTFQQGTNAKAWLFTILRNTFINSYHRKQRRRSFNSDVTAQLGPLGPRVATGCSTNEEPPQAEDEMMQQLTATRISEAIAQLPSDYRESVRLADIEGLSYKEIAEVMECPIGTVMSRIYRGRKMLHKLLYEHALEIGLVTEEDEPGVRVTQYTRNRQRAAEMQGSL